MIKNVLLFLNTKKDLYLAAQIRSFFNKKNIEINLDCYDLNAEDNWAFGQKIKELPMILKNKDKIEKIFSFYKEDSRINYLKKQLDIIKKFKQYDLYCFSLFDNYMDVLLSLSLILKKTYPNSKILFGGPDIILKDSLCNIIKKLDMDYSQGDIDVSVYDYITDYDNFYKNKHIQKMNNLTVEDVPKYSKEELDYLNYEIMISSSRGCANNCRFCSSPALSPFSFVRRDVLIEWMKHYNKIGVKKCWFNDATLNKIDFNILLDGLISINNKIKISRVDISFESLKLDHINKMKKAGFVDVSFGIECLHPKLQKTINKKMPDIRQIFEYLEEFEKNNIEVRLFYIAGIPTQTNEIFEEELEVLIEIEKRFKNVTIELYDYFVSEKSYIENHFQDFNIKQTNLFNDSIIKKLPMFADELKKYKFYSFDNSIEYKMKKLYKSLNNTIEMLNTNNWGE